MSRRVPASTTTRSTSADRSSNHTPDVDEDDEDESNDEHEDEQQHTYDESEDEQQQQQQQQQQGETKLTNTMNKMNITSPTKEMTTKENTKEITTYTSTINTNANTNTNTNTNTKQASLLKSVPAGAGTGSTQPAAAPSSQKAKSQALADPLSAVRRNTKGGIHVNPVELKQAFEFFDSEGKGYITIADLKKRLGVFYQNLSLREYKFLMNNKQELTEADLYQLLVHNELTNYDPVAEAFKIYDPENTGYIDLDVFREILANLGFGEITEQDIQTLIDTADVDGDGKVSLSDFRKMLPTSQSDKPEKRK